MKLKRNWSLLPGLVLAFALTAIGASPPAAAITSWTAIGPTNAAGRIRAIAVHPTQNNKMWVGSPGGGVWKTTDGGANWSAVNDLLPSLAVTSIVLTPGNPDVMYASTGDLPNSAYAFYDWREGNRGAGVIKSTDGGANWTVLAPTSPANNLDWQYVHKLAVHPTNGNILLAATAQGGVYRSIDGGASWTKVRSDAASDVQFDPTNGNNALAITGSRAWYSTNAGASWTESTSFNSGANATGGTLAYSNLSGVVYASVDSSASCCTLAGLVKRSSDGGATWTTVGQPNQFGAARPFANAIWVDPINSDHIIVGGQDLYRSTNGGVNWTQISSGTQAGSVPPAHYAITASPGYNGSTNRTIFFGTGSGVYKATDIQGVTATNIGWTSLNNGLAIMELYSGAARWSSDDWRVLGGASNGVFRSSRLELSTGTWSLLLPGEGGAVGMTPENEADVWISFAAAPRLRVYRSMANDALPMTDISSGIGDTAGIGSANVAAPVIEHPNSGLMLAGGLSLWRTTNGSSLWSNIRPMSVPNDMLFGEYISAIAIAPGNSNVIWIGTNGTGVYRTTNGTAASPAWTRMGEGTLPTGAVRTILVDTNDSNRVHVGLAPSAFQNPANFQSLWRTTDGGTTWTSVSAGLGSKIVRSIVRGSQYFYLYAGTDAGVMVTYDGGLTWASANPGLPNVRVNQLFWGSGNLFAATQGRGMFWASGFQSPPAARRLSVQRSGTGGSIGSSPPGISCPGDCTETYPVDTLVTLTATDSDGKQFSSWSGACTGTSRTCTLTVGSILNVTATFVAEANPTLTVFKSGTGSGPVTSSPAGITCGSLCSANFAYNASVTLTATPNSGSVFAGWSGACTGTASTCMVSMTASRQVTATFNKAGQTLTVSKAGTGSGPVTSSPGGIVCGSACSATFPDGTSVTLSATPNSGSVFTGWSGACAGTSSTCVVSMLTPKSVTATFNTASVTGYALTISKAGTGSGPVTSSPSGIACGSACTYTFASGASVTLTATPNAGSVFAGWTGACTGTSTCVVSMTAAKSVTATFNTATVTSYALTVSKAGSGTGPVTSSPSGIACGSTCSRSFPSSTTVTLTATANTGSLFAGWSGDCTGGVNTCVVSMTANRNVTAAFVPTLPLAQALDNTGLQWSSHGNAIWFAQTSITFDGVDAAQSGGLAANQFSALSTSVLGPGTLSFRWRVASQTGFDLLSFRLDGAVLTSISGDSGWQLQSWSIPAGLHTLEWRYAKDGSISSNGDRAWLDQVQYGLTGSAAR